MGTFIRTLGMAGNKLKERRSMDQTMGDLQALAPQSPGDGADKNILEDHRLHSAAVVGSLERRVLVAHGAGAAGAGARARTWLLEFSE
jgi:hypothetical protein